MAGWYDYYEVWGLFYWPGGVIIMKWADYRKKKASIMIHVVV